MSWWGDDDDEEARRVKAEDVRRTIEREERWPLGPCTCQWCLAEWIADREQIENNP